LEKARLGDDSFPAKASSEGIAAKNRSKQTIRSFVFMILWTDSPSEYSPRNRFQTLNFEF
jgi:hypothetical protein